MQKCQGTPNRFDPDFVNMSTNSNVYKVSQARSVVIVGASFAGLSVGRHLIGSKDVNVSDRIYYYLKYSIHVAISAVIIR